MARVYLLDRAQRVEDQGVSRRQFAWVRDNLIGVIDRGIERDTPRLVAHDSFTVLASGICRVAVAAKCGGWDVIDFGIKMISSSLYAPELPRLPRTL